MELSLAKLKLINRGAGSNIYTYGQLDQAVVLKMVKSNSKESKYLLNQYTILKQLHHEFIISPFKFKRCVNTENLYSASQNLTQSISSTEQFDQESYLSDILVLEHAQKGSLLEVIKKQRLSVPQARFFFHQICEAVDYLHCNYIVHRDLKLQNIFVSVQDSALVCKIGDFGFASSCIESEKLVTFNSFKGTKRGYMAPEIHNTLKNPDQFYDARKSDVFALGVILFALLLGKLPFEYANMQNNLYKLIAQEKYDFFWKEHAQSLKKLEMSEFSMIDEFKELFISMVKFDPNSRIRNGQWEERKIPGCEQRLPTSQLILYTFPLEPNYNQRKQFAKIYHQGSFSLFKPISVTFMGYTYFQLRSCFYFFWFKKSLCLVLLDYVISFFSLMAYSLLSAPTQTSDLYLFSIPL